MNFAVFRPWFDQRFSALLKEKIVAFTAHSSSASVAEIAAYAQTLSDGGKRFRPYLTYVASGCSEEELEHHMCLLAATELLHIFALIHDDIMDNAETRHGVVCAHKHFASVYGTETATAIAILLGDIVLAWAYECLFEYTSTFPEIRDDISAEFKALVSEVTHGQILDVLSPKQATLSFDALIEKMTLKTARYSFVRPLRLGAILGRTITTQGDFIEQFGTALGIAFQLQDDLLDFVTPEQSGKSSFVDVESGQQTILSWFMYTKAHEEDRTVFDTYFGNGPIEASVKEVLRAHCTEAVAFVRAQADTYFAQAKNCIDSEQILPNKEVWHNIVALIEQRKK